MTDDKQPEDKPAENPGVPASGELTDAETQRLYEALAETRRRWTETASRWKREGPLVGTENHTQDETM